MYKYLTVLLLVFCLSSQDSLARGGFSSGGRGGFSSSRSFSSPSRSFSAPRRSFSSPSTTTTRRTTTVSRSYGGRYSGYHPMMYPGFGMGYGYSNGILTGLIIGNLMHPSGTTAYTGGGYSGSALLYPDGRVVDQNGYQVGTYQDGHFNAMQGGMVAQPAPTDAAEPPAQPVVIKRGYSGWEITGGIIIGVFVIVIIIVICI